MKWDPFREIGNLQNSINRLFNERFFKWFDQEGLSEGWGFPADIKETPEHIIIKAEIPGLSRDEIKVTFANNQLSIRGERRKELTQENERFLRMERSYGSFYRSFTIDVPVDEKRIKARCQDGVLEVILPKREEARSQEINIEVE